ncbi:alpha/beta-hydrolase [Xylariaceae sp. AK1471]|nr:alpha/beta-hydrolase [Xylariaceae sp. AK1471]
MTMIEIIIGFLFMSWAQPWGRATPQCHDVHFTFSTTAANRVANNPPRDLFSDPEAINAFLGQPVAYQNVSGTFTLYGQVCRPLNKEAAASRTPKLQLLVHGSTYNHTYWSSLQDPSDSAYNELSWIHTATRLGYWTLAIDRLGQGRSSKPDPVTVVQDPLQTQLLHLLARRIRDDDVLGIGFSTKRSGGGGGGGKLIYVGHSFGSGLGVHLAAAHPGDFDGLVLTGIATVRGNPQPGSFLARWAPAAQAFPERFPSDLPGGYLVSTNKTGREGLYWGAHADFDAALFERDWAGQGTHPLGEVFTVAEYLAALPGPAFDKPVLVADGSADAIFCSDLGSRDLGPVGCRPGDDGEIGKTREWFSGVPRELFATYLQPDSGHDHILHKTGNQLISHAHDWLASVGL